MKILDWNSDKTHILLIANTVNKHGVVKLKNVNDKSLKFLQYEMPFNLTTHYEPLTQIMTITSKVKSMNEIIKQDLLTVFNCQDSINELNEYEAENVEDFEPLNTWQEYVKYLIDLNCFEYRTLSEFIVNSEIELSYDSIEYARILHAELTHFGIDTSGLIL